MSSVAGQHKISAESSQYSRATGDRHVNKIWKLFRFFILVFAAFVPSLAAQELPRVTISTELGEIVIEIDTVRAPITAFNFLGYVDGGFYNGGRFHRTVHPDNQPNDSIRIEVIQAGINSARSGEGFSPIPLERTNITGIRHQDGTISMARGGPDSATSSFFICLGEQSSLDYGGFRNSDGQGFAAFGRVVRGMDVVRQIQQRPAEAQTLTPPVGILSANRVEGL